VDIKIFLHEFIQKRFTSGIHSLLKRNDARGSAYIICIIWRISNKHSSRTEM